ncbi:MAG: NUDIX domain-containing protein [bacterium]|nr:NUDIX domain-containing protein [bacterium]
MDKKDLIEELKKQTPVPGLDPEIFDILRGLVPMVALELFVTRTEGGFGLKKKKVGDVEGWSLPGGFIGMNESFEKACERIAQRELGIKVTDLKFLNVFNWPEGSDRPARGHAVTLLFSCIAQEASDHIAYFRQIPKDTLPHHRTMLETGLKLVN